MWTIKFLNSQGEFTVVLWDGDLSDWVLENAEQLEVISLTAMRARV